jgi:type IV pilus assembly protein PilA
VFTKLREKTDDEEGFTLIELLVVVIIIGILATVAIPVFLNQRESAWQSSVEADLRNAATDMETYFAANGTYDSEAISGSSGTDWTSTDEGSDGVEVSADATSDSGFCLSASHSSFEDTTYYDSDGGGINTTGCSSPSESESPS